MNDWMDQAACRGANTEVFFPGKSDDWQVPVAVCNRCPVVHPCAVWGLRYEQNGVWGGLTGQQRERARVQLRVRLRTPRSEVIRKAS